MGKLAKKIKYKAILGVTLVYVLGCNLGAGCAIERELSAGKSEKEIRETALEKVCRGFYHMHILTTPGREVAYKLHKK